MEKSWSDLPPLPPPSGLFHGFHRASFPQRLGLGASPLQLGQSIILLYNLSSISVMLSGAASFVLTAAIPAGGKRGAPRPSPGFEAPTLRRWSLLLGREFPSRFGPSHLSGVSRHRLVPTRLSGNRSLSEYGLGGPSATTGFLLQCADFAAPTFFPERAAVLQNSIDTACQRTRNGGLGDIGFLLVAAQAVVAAAPEDCGAEWPHWPP